MIGPTAQMPGSDADGSVAIIDERGSVISLPERLTEKERKPLLNKLYGELRRAPSPEAAGSIEQAIEQVWLTTGDDNIDFIMQNAILAMEEQDFATAEELLDRVIELAPGYAEGWNKRAMVHYMKKEYEPALLKLRQALALDPHHFQALHGLALVLQEIGDRRMALQAFRTLLRMNPQFAEAREAVEELSRQVNGQGT